MWFDGERQPNTMYVANVSRGKDSTAMLRAIRLMGWPLDAVVAVDIWATQDIPAELPPMVEFKEEWDRKCLEHFGIPVTRICATKREGESQREDGECHSQYETYESYFYRKKITGKFPGEYVGFPIQRNSWCKKLKTEQVDLRGHLLSQASGQALEREREMRIKNPNGDFTIQGFPLQRGPVCQSSLKRSQLSNASVRSAAESLRIPNAKRQLVYQQSQESGNSRYTDFRKGLLDRPFSSERRGKAQKINIVHYIGIATDEPERVARHMPKNDMIMPLVQIGWDEALCGLEATYLDMLSPTYTTSMRDGCWFCHNQGVGQLRNLRHNYPDLWALLMKWDTDSPVTFHADGHTVHDFDRRFQLEDEGIIKPDEKFRWAMLENQQMRFF